MDMDNGDGIVAMVKWQWLMGNGIVAMVNGEWNSGNG
jgi:hypothetical protein